MLCDICKQNVATVHLTQMVDGKTKKVDLCEACSKEKGVDDPTGFSLADLLLGLLHHIWRRTGKTAQVHAQRDQTCRQSPAAIAAAQGFPREIEPIAEAV